MGGVSGVRDERPNPPQKEIELNVVGDNGGSRMCIYLQCEFYTKTFYKPSVKFISSMLFGLATEWLDIDHCVAIFAAMVAILNYWLYVLGL